MASPARFSIARAIAAREPNLTGDFAGAIYLPAPGFRSRSGRTGQGLCGAVQAQGRPLSRRRCANARTGRRRLAHRRTGWRGRRARGRGGTGTVVRSGVSSARIFDPARRQARLPSASGAARQRRAQSSRSRFRSRLSAGADEPRHSPHHRRGVCPPRCAADADPARAGAAAGARAVSAGRAGRCQGPGWARGRACPTCCR